MGYNEGITRLHELEKNKTIKEVQETIAFIKQIEGENATITPKKILDNCSLSRSVLYKKHVLNIWNPILWKEKFERNSINSISIKQHNDINKQLLEEMLNYQKTIKKQSKTIKQIENKLIDSNKRVEFYKVELRDITEENSKLLSECQRLHNILNMHGLH